MDSHPPPSWNRSVNEKPSNHDAGIRLVLEELRDLRREAAEDRKRAESRLARIEEKQDRTLI